MRSGATMDPLRREEIKLKSASRRLMDRGIHSADDTAEHTAFECPHHGFGEEDERSKQAADPVASCRRRSLAVAWLGCMRLAALLSRVCRAGEVMPMKVVFNWKKTNKSERKWKSLT
ncbi:Hypothetical protein CINCED_3A007629 [Cinara cedri]|uniref:Uncharacterized protein n=1 Tax=Cinara cedri TaxID=506608 RepID=A0A5E4NJ54_9HEMI|nr:Hypothetical protein CINCED_3A007629 [Cinara cedri]